MKVQEITIEVQEESVFHNVLKPKCLIHNHLKNAASCTPIIYSHSAIYLPSSSENENFNLAMSIVYKRLLEGLIIILLVFVVWGSLIRGSI